MSARRATALLEALFTMIVLWAVVAVAWALEGVDDTSLWLVLGGVDIATMLAMIFVWLRWG